MTLVSSSTAVMTHYHQGNTGTSLGWLGSSQSLFPLLFIFLYNMFFVNGHYEDPIHQNLGGFLILIATCFGVLNLGGIFLYFTPQDDSSQEEHKENKSSVVDKNVSLSEGEHSIHSKGYADLEKLPLTNGLIDNNGLYRDSPEIGIKAKLSIYHSQSSTESSSSGKAKPDHGDKMNLCQLFTHISFWCISLSFMTIAGITTMHINNLTTYLAAFGLDDYAASIPYINPALGCIYRPAIGYIGDRLEHYIPKPWYLIAATLCLSVFSLLAIFYLGDVTFVIIFYIIVDAAISTCVVFTPDLLITNFGITNFPTTYGFCIGLQAGALVLFQYLFGLTYDAQVLDDNTMSCYGLHCFTTSLIMSTAVSLVALLLCTYLMKDYYSSPLKCCQCQRIKHGRLEE